MTEGWHQDMPDESGMPDEYVSPDHSERTWCERHREWYVPFTGPMDPNGVPCPGCHMEAEAHWSEAEDHNIRTVLGLPDA